MRMQPQHNNQRNIFSQFQLGEKYFLVEMGGSITGGWCGGGREKIDVNYSWTLQTAGTHPEVWLGTEEPRQGGEGGVEYHQD